MWYRQTETTRYQMPSAVTRSHMPAEPSTSGTATIDGCCAPTPYRRACCRALPAQPDSAESAQAPHAVVCSADSQGSQISRAHTGPKRRQQGRERLQRPAAGVALNSRGQKRCRQCPRVLARAPRPPTPSYACLELPEVTFELALLQPSREKHDKIHGATLTLTQLVANRRGGARYQALPQARYERCACGADLDRARRAPARAPGPTERGRGG